MSRILAIRRAGLAVCFLIPALIVMGCGTSDGRLPVHPVKGQVLVGGKPVKGVRLSFWPAGTKPEGYAYCPSGETDESGNFTLSTYESGDGAPEGQYTVTATWPLRFNIVTNQWEGDKLKGKYKDSDGSKVKITITPGENQIPPIQLSE